MTTYTYTKPLKPSTNLQKRIRDARQRAADLAAEVELKRLETQNAETQATLEALAQRNRQTIDEIHRRRNEAKKYPIHPQWAQHRAEAIAEIKHWEAQRPRTSGPHARVVGSVAGGNGLGGMVGPGEVSRPLESAFHGVSA